jgi:phosphatidylserine decarboxylase
VSQVASTPLRLALSRCAGWLADRRVPRALRGPLYRSYARWYGVDLSELRIALDEHPSFAAFFVRRLREGARAFASDPELLPAPCDGTLQAAGEIAEDSLLQAKGRPYSVRALLAGAGAGAALDGGFAWTIYLSPRDYHRVHAPFAGALADVRWVPGSRHSVAPRVLERRDVLARNERAVLTLATADGPHFLVLVGAFNVGRIRVVGVERRRDGAIDPPRAVARGDELARFELGSTVVLIAPRGSFRPIAGPEPGARVRMGEPLGRRARPA